MNKKEADVTREKIKYWWLKACPDSSPCEVKHTRGKNRFPLRELVEHQRDWLCAAATERGCIWKIPDAGFAHNPFDLMMYKNAKYPSVAIAFPTWVVAIHIHDLIILNSPSIDEETALQMSNFKVLLKDL